MHRTDPRTSSWLTGPPGSRWHQTLKPRLTPVFSDCQLFCGFALYGLMFAAMYGTKNPTSSTPHSPATRNTRPRFSFTNRNVSRRDCSSHTETG